MAVINFGSINIDHVYQVNHFVQPGETLASNNYQQLLGGKGANQSIALSKAGTNVKHVGKLSESDAKYKQALIDYGIDCNYVEITNTASGHAIIQVSDSGENAIVLFGGANMEISQDDITHVFSQTSSDDWVLMQNETNAIDLVMQQAKSKGLKVAFNPAPMTESVKSLPLECVDLLIVNEVEAEELTGESELDKIETYFRKHMPQSEVLITLGKSGVRMLTSNDTFNQSAFVVKAVDTTAAGDTFIGYFLSAYSQGVEPKQALKRACAASAIAVTQQGAAQSIPNPAEVDSFLLQQN